MERFTPWVAAAIFASILLFSNLGGWGLWSPDEPRYAEVAREMATTKDWVIPHLNGKVYTKKPPLLFWIDALSYRILGTSESTARLPVALMGLATVLLTFHLGSVCFSKGVGLWGALILVTSPLFAWEARRAKMDIPLTLFMVLAILAFYRGNLLEQKEKRKKMIHYASGFMAIGVGALGKGPVAFSIPCITLACYHLYRRDLHILKEKEFWLAFPLAFLPFLLWLTPAVLKLGPGYAMDQIYYRTSALFLHTKVHRHSFFYYFYHLLGDYFPWILFLPGALVYGFKLKEEEKRAFILLFWWFIANFLFFCLAKTKRTTYLLPLYPAMAIMVSLFLKGDNEKYVKHATTFAIALMAIVGVVAPLVAFFELRLLFLPLSGMGIILLLLSMGGLYLMRKGTLNTNGYLIAVVAISLIYSFFVLIPKADPCKSVERVCKKAVELSRREEATLALYGIGNAHAGEFNFYTQMVPLPIIKKGDKSIQRLLTEQERIFLITKGRYFDKLRRRYRFKPLAQQPCGHRFTLFSNKDFEGE